MERVLLVGTAVTRPGAVGTVYRATGDGGFVPARGIPLDTGVQALTPHPARRGLVFAATHAGLYRSADSGGSWTRLDVPSAPGEHFWALAIHPTNPDILLAGCGPIGVYKSIDGGAHWRRVGSNEPMAEVCDMSVGKMFRHSRLMSIAFDPTRPRLVYGACETSGFIVSEDEGETWRNESAALMALVAQDPALRSQINVPDDNEGILDGHSVCVSSNKPGVVFYACRMGLFSSADKGKSWRNHDIGRFAPITYSRDLRVGADAPNILYLALSISSRSNAGALYRSDDTGETWRRADAPVTAHSTIMGMGASTQDPGTVVYITRGGQVHWGEDDCLDWDAKQLPASAGDGYCAAIL